MSSTTQSHIQTGPQSNFNFNQPQRLTQMHPRPDPIRQPGMPQISQMGSHHFIQNRQQPEQHGQPPMGMLTNNTNLSANPLGSVAQGHNPAQAQRLQQQIQQADQQRRRQDMLVHAQNAQTMNPSGNGTPGPHLGLGHNQIASQGFPGNMQPANNAQVRRVQPQTQPMNQSVGQMQIGGIMHSAQQAGGSMGIAINAQSAQMRQATHSQMGLRMHQIQGSQISPDMGMANRQPGNPGIPQNIQRSASAQQPMASLPQPPGHTQAHQVGMQSLPSNNFHNPMSHHSQTMSPSPRLGNRSQPQTPASINLPNPGQSQPNTSRSQSDPFGFSAYSFVPSSVSPSSQHAEMSQQMGAVTNNASGPNNRVFQPTPAQQLQSCESYNNSYNMPPPHSNVPPRPSSNNNIHAPLHQQQQSQHHSPQQQENLTGQQLQRPQSQPQPQPRRPPSQSDFSSTPRTANLQLPGPPSGRMPPLSQQPQPGGSPALHSLSSSVAHPLPIAPRPPQPGSTAVGLSSTTSTSFPPPEGGPSQGQPSNGIQRPGNMASYPLGVGQGLTRLLQFSGSLAVENKHKLTLSFWDSLVKEFFAPQSILKFTLWKDNQRNEAKPFDIGVPILPRFFLVTTQSGVKSMTLSLDGARERLISHQHAVIECVTAAWTCRYTNGYTVTLRGPLTAHVVMVHNNPRTSQPFSLKFENFEFVANFHDKSISLESILDYRNHELSSPKTPRTKNTPIPTANGSTAQAKTEEDKKWEEPRVTIDHASIPGEPVNAFGIPQATMRCLELAESVGQMADLIAFSEEVKTGPIEGLSLYAAKIREVHNSVQGGMNNSNNSFQNFSTLNGSPAVTLYSSAPPSATASSDSQPGPSAGPSQNAPSSASNSPQKQHKTIPQPAGPPPTSGQASGSSSTPSGSTMTPSLSNASLKRKQTDTASPTTGSEPKRSARKRGRPTG